MRHPTSHRVFPDVLRLWQPAPQQGWVRDPGWAPLSNWRSQASWAFFCLPSWSHSCELKHNLFSVLVILYVCGFSNFYNYFWAVSISGRTVYVDFYDFFFLMKFAHPLVVLSICINIISQFRPSQSGLESANSLLYRDLRCHWLQTFWYMRQDSATRAK